MNDQQFDALLGALTKISESLNGIDEKLSTMNAMYLAINDPEGWDEACDQLGLKKDLDESEDCDLGGVS